MIDNPRIYLAGPDVFLPNPKEVGRNLQSICEKHHLKGVFPLDAELKLDGLTSREQGLLISSANEELIRNSQGVIANLMPFRGPSADVGTVYEVGMARGLGKIIVGYTDDPYNFYERTCKWILDQGFNPSVKNNRLADNNDMEIENFSMVDNLMIEGGIIASGGKIFKTFEDCVIWLSGHLRNDAKERR